MSIRPACYNRPPATDPNAGWHNTGRTADVALPPPRYSIEGDTDLSGWLHESEQALRIVSRPVYRYRWPWFEDRCTQHDGTGVRGPAAEHAPYAVAMGFDCAGCRWLPLHLVPTYSLAAILDKHRLSDIARDVRVGATHG